MTEGKHTGKILDGRYELVRLLDEGGMGAVYQGRHIKIGRKVAVKLLHAALVVQEDVVKRFYREAQAASAIAHPNIVDIYDVGVAEWGEPYLVMEYLSGENLDSFIMRKEPLSLAASCAIVEPALRGLSAAHDQGIVHRDIKPDNIFIVRRPDAPPTIKIFDFGISKFVEDDTLKLTRTGTLLGTPSYMSPEQARGKGEVDHRADIFSLGVILYRMLTGALPFEGESYNDLIFTILTESFRNPFEVNPDFPSEAGPIIERILKKEPAARYQSCQEVLAALEALPAYESRIAALHSLAADIPDDRFATGDLGGMIKPGQAVAETVLASISPNSPTVIDPLPSNEVETVVTNVNPNSPTVFEPSSQDDEAETVAMIRGVVSREDEWVMTGGRVPRKTRQTRRGLTWPYLLVPAALVASVALFIGSGLWKLPFSKPVTATETETLSLQQKKDQSLKAKTLKKQHDPGQFEDGATTHMDESDQSIFATVGETDDLGTDDATETDSGAHAALTSSGDTASDNGKESAAETPVTTGLGATKLAPQKSWKKPFNTKAKIGVPKKPVTWKKPVKAVTSPTKTENAEETPEKSSNELPDKPVAAETPTAPLPEEAPAPTDSIRALTPADVNRLLAKKDARIEYCYNMAQIQTPDLAGTLKLRVGIEGHDIHVTVLSNTTNATLEACVKRALITIVPPANNGTLVEIEKSYNFAAE